MFSALALTAVLLLGGCAVPGDSSKSEQAAVGPAPTPAEVATPSEPASTSPAVAAPATPDPAVAVPPATPVPAARTTDDLVDPKASCKTDADCAIKDVGSCCGYNPRCVNKDSPTFPEQVKAQCANTGRVGICGFPSISGCECKAGKCAGVAGPDDGEVVQ